MPTGLSFLDFQDIRAGSKTLSTRSPISSRPPTSAPRAKPERGWIEAVSPGAFDQMGVTVVLGRPLQPGDGELPPGTPVAVLTHSYWQNHFGGDPGVIGRPVIVNGKTLTIVGVAKPGFDSFSWSLAVSMFVPSGTHALLVTGG
jgi:putative ABC transport system permease protein